MSFEAVSRRIKLQHLRVVTAIAQVGSMAAAAKQLAISQPVVSKVVADLEAELGVRLFDRSSRGVEPTVYGRALVKRSLAIFDELRTGVDEIRFLSDPGAGELRLGSTEPLVAGLVAAAMGHLWQHHPRIALRMVQAESATLLDRDLPERRIEIALIPVREVPRRDDLEATLLYRDHWHVVAGVDSPWARRRKIALSDLVDESWCATPIESSIGSLLAEAFAAKGLRAPRLAVSGVLSPYFVARLLEDSGFVAVMADSQLNFFHAERLRLKRLPVELPMRPFSIALVTLRNRTISPAAQLFADAARRVGVDLEKHRAAAQRRR